MKRYMRLKKTVKAMYVRYTAKHSREYGKTFEERFRSRGFLLHLFCDE